MTFFVKGIVLLSIFLVFQTNPSIVKIDDTEQVKLFNSIEDMKRYDVGHFSTTIFFISNPPGSAGFQGTGEISHDLLVATSEFDEFPKQNLFALKDIINPKIVESSINDEIIELTIEHYSSGKLEKGFLTISFDRVDFHK